MVDINILWVADHIAFTTEAHTHEFYHLIFCKKKGGKINVGNDVYTAKSDYVYLVKPRVLHSMTIGSEMRLIEIKFIINDEMINKYLERVPNEFQLSDVLLMKTMLLLIATEGINDKLYSNDAANSALKLFLTYVMRQFNNTCALKQEDINHKAINNNLHEKKNRDIMILGLENYIENNLHREITLTELAHKVGYNKTYFIKRFKILFGISPMQFVNNLRLEKAKQMLSSTDKSITEIAESTGFQCIHYFSRNFKHNIGVMPSEYRKKYRL